MTDTYMKPKVGKDDEDHERTFVMFYYENETTTMCLRFKKAKHAHLWGEAMQIIKDKAAEIVRKWPKNTTPDTQTTESRNRIVAWLQAVDSAKETWGVIATSILDEVDAFRRSVDDQARISV